MCDYIDEIKKLQDICNLINHKNTGTPIQLARKLGISESTVKRMVGQLRDRGFNIQYNKIRRSYTCKDGFSIQCNVDIKYIPE